MKKNEEDAHGKKLTIARDCDFRFGKNQKGVLLADITADCRIGFDCSAGSESTVILFQQKKAKVKIITDVKSNARIAIAAIWTQDGTVEDETRLKGSRSHAELVHLFFGNRGSSMSFNSILSHEAASTSGNVLIKGTLRDRSKANMAGLISVARGSNDSRSFLGTHAMLLDRDCIAVARPTLEISNNDVASRHAASVSEIDPEKLFYVMSRGIAEDDAKKLLTEGFMLSAVEKLGIGDQEKEIVRDRIADSV